MAGYRITRLKVSVLQPLMVWGAGVGLLLACGCNEQYWAETVVHSDGSIDRSIWQPASSVPSSHGWLFFRPVERPQQTEKPVWPENLDDLPPPEEQADENAYYILAKGSFASAANIPPHFRVATADGQRHAQLVREYQRNNYGWYIEHRWQETLTDVVTLSDMRQARRELATAGIELLEEILHDAYGQSVDTSALSNWLRSEGISVWEEATDTVYQTCLAPGGHRRIEAELYRLLARHGLELLPRENDAASQENDRRIRVFVMEKLTRLLHGPDGQPVPESVVKEVLELLLPSSDSPEQPTRLQRVATDCLTRKYGSQEKFDSYVQSLLARIFGVHLVHVGKRYFRYDMQVPGVIMETTGRLIDDNRVRWEFEAVEAYPEGYRMWCRSIEPNAEAQRALWGEVRFADRASLSKLDDAVRQDASLAEAIQATVRHGTLEALGRWAESSPPLPPPQCQWIMEKTRKGNQTQHK